ncbi:hypothetical protein BMR05_15415 [Methylococcaceae bacterium HT4]|nr:hypothetical protein BMR05_15415 [Methylococcaceae bacterium HT4]
MLFRLELLGLNGSVAIIIKSSDSDKTTALRLSQTKNLHFAKATFPRFSAIADNVGKWGLCDRTLKSPN